MGFQKGSITLSPRKDIPLLLQVLHSRLITHNQLQEFMLLDNYEVKQKCFNWRVRRLVQAGLLNRECASPITPSPVYSITPVAALVLAEHCPVLDNGKQKDSVSANHLRHSIGLNELHLSLSRQGILEDWQSEVTIRAKNELTSSGYVKDYDAIVTVRIEERQVTFALEYERTPKKSREYLQIRNLLEQENRIDRFVYIVPEPDLGSFIVECFSGTRVALYVGLADEFTRSFAEMKMIEASSGMTRWGAAAL
jgi:DNA-binding HxlR family transcriptional regulator